MSGKFCRWLVEKGVVISYKPKVLIVPEGGSGVITNTAYAVLCGGTTATGAIQSIAGVGTSGQVLTSNGAANLPTFQDAIPSYATSTWSPEITGSASNPTVAYTTQLGKYTQIGNVVYAKAVITINTISGGSGLAQVSLPFTASSDSITNVGDCALSGVSFPTTTSWINLQVVPNTAVGIFRASRDNLGSSDVQISNLANGDTIRYQIVFWV